METLSILGVAAFAMVTMLLGLPKEVKDIKKKVKKLSKLVEGDKSMSKLLEELVGKKCSVYAGGVVGNIVGVVIAVDEDWVKFELENKKGKKKLMLYPIEDIASIEIME